MIAKTFFNCGRELTGARRLALAVTLASSFGIQAADNLAAHAHGDAQLQVAVSGQTLDLIMESPAANLIGFEHRPRTKAEQEALDAARDWLANTALIDTEDKASCRVLDASVMHSLMASEDRHSNDNHGHEGHSEHKEDKPGTSHSEFVVSQSLECQDLTPGRTLTTPLLGRFPGIERLQLQWVSAKGQGGADLKADDNRFQLRQ